MLLRGFVYALVLLCAFNSAYGISEEAATKIANGFRNTCMQKVGIDLALATQIREGIFPDDPGAKCYTKCIMSTIRAFKGGKLDFETLKKQVNAMVPIERQASMLRAIDTCTGPPLDDPCETTYEYLKCTHKEAADVYFFP